ncbi:hypothetical protein NXS19_009349 [Fusarium pseudograminearum]|nr:hypothetical protein NXS19_009349 [Fusarium pseudograminearum]
MASLANDEEMEDIQPLHIPSNPYATSYKSNYTVPDNGILDAQDLVLLQHLNCSYFSSGRPPTLLALKQHAHSLVNIIRKLALTSNTQHVGERSGYRFEEHEAFDWLNNLDEPYENDDPSHHDPLWALQNTVKSESETFGGDQRRPYMTHHDLVMHANECLEILDHEYGATGGLMSILPTGFEAPKDLKAAQGMSERQLEGARNCLLGQWLLNHQHLMGRMHELEISYANALDVMAGEALVPQQILGRSGPDGVSGGGRLLLDAAEAQIEQKEKIWKASGVVGERIWREERGGKVYARGIVPIDISSRFYRIKGKGSQSPLFVIPAADQHPGTAQTRIIESKPTVVSVVTPTWPERVSDIEARNKERLARAAQLETENRTLLRERVEMQDMIAVKTAEIRSMNDQLAWYEENAEVQRK